MAKYHKTRCVHCKGGIEFPSHGVDEWIQCPHCSQMTVLRPKKIVAAVVGSLTLAVLLCGALFLVAEYREQQEAIILLDEAKQQEIRQQAERDLALVQLELMSQQYERQQAQREESTKQFAAERAAVLAESHQRDILFEMREANQIARDAAFDAKWPRRTESPVIVPQPVVTYDWYSEWQKQQALNGIRDELQQMRFDQHSWLIQQSFQPITIYPRYQYYY